ncbi:MAG: PepSY-associated TM helix domain-containing protein [Bradyrhizobium sp.]|nr:PepSY-associated TM helix domain-containing protein [Bradyrhizobium sp.]
MINLKARETKTLVAVHGWAGAVLGLLLYAVIVTGTAAVFSNEIKLWSGGLLGMNDPLGQPLGAVLARLEAETPREFREDLALRATPAGNVVAFFHTDEMVKGERRERGVVYTIGPNGRVISRQEGFGRDISANDPHTALGRFYVDLHVRLHLPNPWGLILTGILGLAMLVAAVSGILMHRHLFRDIFLLRSRERLVGLRDLHSVAGTWTLPHAFVLAFTGAYLSFAIAVALPMLAKIAFKGDVREMVTTLNGTNTVDARPADIADIDAMLSDARKRAGAPLLSAGWENRGRADSRITVFPAPRPGDLTAMRLIYNGATGELIRERPIVGTRPSVGSSLLGLVGPVHFGNFAGWWSRAVWFALGAASAYVAWSGLNLWVRRRADQRGWRVLGRLTVWVGGGLPFAMAAAAAAYFVSLPSLSPVFWTPAAFLIAAALALVLSLSMRPVERIAPILFGATGIVLIALPPLRAAAGGPAWGAALATGQSAVPVMDVLVVLGGIVCVVSAAITLRAREQGTCNAGSIMQSAE